MNWQFVEVLRANKDRLNIQDRCAHVNVPTLLVHGTEDPTVPYSEAQEMVEWNKSFELLAIEGADHSFGGKHPLECDSLTEHMQLVVDSTVRHFKALVR